MVNKFISINGGGYGQTYKVHINPFYGVKTACMILGGDLNE